MTDTDLRAFYTRYIDTLNAHDFAAVGEFLHDDLTYFGEAVTAEQIVGVLTELGEAVPDLRWDIEDLTVDGDHLAARLVNTGTPTQEWLGVPATGRSFRITEYAVYEIRESRFLHMTNVHDGDALRAQLT